MHYANGAIYSRAGRLGYLSHHSHYAQAWSKPWVLAASHRERWWGAERATFFCVCTLRAAIHTEVCPPRQLLGFDSMEWEGPPLPRVWYNESRLSAQHLERATWNGSSSKQHNKQRWFILYTCSGSAPRRAGRVGGQQGGWTCRVAGLFMCDGQQRGWVIY